MVRGRGRIHSRYDLSSNCKDQTNLQAPIRRINKIKHHILSATKSLFRESRDEYEETRSKGKSSKKQCNLRKEKRK